MSVTSQAVADIVKEPKTKVRGHRKERSHFKIFWDRRYNNWSETEFKEYMRVVKGTFESILNRISSNIYKTSTNIEPNSLEAHRQLAMTLRRLDDGCSFWGYLC